MIQADAAQSRQLGGARQERFKIRDGELRLPGFDEFTDLPDDGPALPEQWQIRPETGGQLHAVLAVNEDETGNFPHVGQTLTQHLESLVAGQHLDFMAQPQERTGDGVNARRVSLAFAAAAIKNTRHVMCGVSVNRMARKRK